jgi:hypothetical protein
LILVETNKIKKCEEKKNIYGHSVGKRRVIYEQFEDTKGVIRTRKSYKGRRCNGKKKKDKH